MSALPLRLHIPGHQPPVQHHDHGALLVKFQADALDGLDIPSVSVEHQNFPRAVLVQPVHNLVYILVQYVGINVDGSRIISQ